MLKMKRVSRCSTNVRRDESERRDRCGGCESGVRIDEVLPCRSTRDDGVRTEAERAATVKVAGSGVCIRKCAGGMEMSKGQVLVEFCHTGARMGRDWGRGSQDGDDEV
jgi:hypothetical protein